MLTRLPYRLVPCIALALFGLVVPLSVQPVLAQTRTITTEQRVKVTLLAQSSRALLARFDDPLIRSVLALRLGRAYTALGDLEAAKPLLRSGLQEYARINDVGGTWDRYFDSGDMDLSSLPYVYFQALVQAGDIP